MGYSRLRHLDSKPAMPFKSTLSITSLGAACAVSMLAGCAGPGAEAPLIPAKMLSCPKPAYPRSSLRNEETGITTLTFLVGADGLVHDVQIQKSSGYIDLDRASLVLRDCRF